ncbi:receptor-like protein EIX2 [Aristolochia californica]|uniref:receptor-like protein EIX2 n=1 Tax=Aristolochia californica TaxID=171875 RepID=UPI0035D5F7D3
MRAALIVNLFVGFLLLGILCKGISSSQVGCFDVEREALTKFRSKLIDPSNLLASWDATQDCCNWKGVTCHIETGYVIQLNLSHGPYSGQIDAVLLQLKHLRQLDLSDNSFDGVKIPDFIGSLKELRHLNLSYADFSGKIPFHLGNLSYLESLGVSSGLRSTLYADSLDWIVNMPSLKHVGMDGVNLSMVGSRWFHVINSLSSLQILEMWSASLSTFPPTPSFLNLTQLRHLDLSSNQFHSKFPNWLVNITALVSIDLGVNDFYGDISSEFAVLPHLEELSLLYNYNLTVNCSNLFSGSWKNIKKMVIYGVELYGEIPNSIGNMTTLTSLHLGGNRITKGFLSPMGNLHNLQTLFLQGFEDSIAPKLDWLCSLTNLTELHIINSRFPGPLPACLGELSPLKEIGIVNSMLEGVVLENHFQNLSNLIVLDLSQNSLEFRLPIDWLPPFQVREFYLQSCHLGPQFPLWLQTQKNMDYLDLSRTSVGNIPLWFWNITSPLYYLNLSMNNISGSLPYITLHNYTFAYIDLSYNKITGPIPFLTNPVQFLDISYNQFSGVIPPLFGMLESLEILNLSHNNLTGGVPPTLANCGSLKVLDLKANHLSGNIPWSSVQFVNIENLHLEKNKLSGEFPSFLKNCTDLQILDLSGNEFSGSLPRWIGVRLSNLRILQLRSNMFSGTIPELWNLGYLQVLDVSHNRLTGAIPRGITNLAAMRTNHVTNNTLGYGSNYYKENVDVSYNGFVYEFTSTLSLVIALDISNNNLSGTIPEEVGNLIGLIALNLSGNQFFGKIPQSIGKLYQLQNLDLSRNHLSGSIPPAIVSLTFLSHLNLSYNNLSGIIPRGNQLDTLDESNYMGNEGLCGQPLRKECKSDGRDQIPVQPW